MLCCVVLCDSPVEQHFPWAATGDKIQPLLINNSYPPFIAADTLILAAMIEDNYLVCVIMSLPDAMKRRRRGSGKPSAGGVDYGGGGILTPPLKSISSMNLYATTPLLFFFSFFC